MVLGSAQGQLYLYLFTSLFIALFLGG